VPPQTEGKEPVGTTQLNARFVSQHRPRRVEPTAQPAQTPIGFVSQRGRGLAEKTL